ncbi:MAG: GGDEF domain-containing protein [Candidatus Brocadiaceae bacterium]|nr:GGDEF domain-containing protein [Candidatus Brocadiaceae bacterium]
MRAALTNIGVLICTIAAAGCGLLAARFLLDTPLFDHPMLSSRLVLAVPAGLGCVAGLYGIVATVLLATRHAKAERLEARLQALQTRAVELESRHRSQRARIDELSTLREAATIVNNESEFAIIAEKLLELIHALLRPCETVILLRDERKGQMSPFARYADGKAHTGRKAAAARLPHFQIAEFESHSVIARVQAGALHAVLPLKVEDEIHGVLVLAWRKDPREPARQVEEFNRTRRPVLMEIAHHISLAVKAKHLHTRAVVDGLTSLFSRSHFDAQMQAAIELAARTHEPFSLIVIDIDHFKKINDTHGHATGDVVLMRVADRVRAVLRKYDSAYRYGGEELAVLLPRTRLSQAAATAERLRATIEARRFRGAAGSLVPATVSLGVAQYEPSDDADSVFARADECLYRAKESGRNRVVSTAA